VTDRLLSHDWCCWQHKCDTYLKPQLQFCVNSSQTWVWRTRRMKTEASFNFNRSHYRKTAIQKQQSLWHHTLYSISAYTSRRQSSDNGDFYQKLSVRFKMQLVFTNHVPVGLKLFFCVIPCTEYRLVQHCCNDDQQSQWENENSDPCRSETTENFITKIEHYDYAVRCNTHTHTHQILGELSNGCPPVVGKSESWFYLNRDLTAISNSIWQ